MKDLIWSMLFLAMVIIGMLDNSKSQKIIDRKTVTIDSLKQECSDVKLKYMSAVDSVATRLDRIENIFKVVE